MASILSRFSLFRSHKAERLDSSRWKIRANLISTLSVFAINTLVGFAFVGITIRAIGPEAYATYVILSQTIGNATLMAFLFNQNVTRLVGSLSQDKLLGSQELNQLFTLSLLVSSFMLAVVAIAAPGINLFFQIAPYLQVQASWLAALTALSFTLSGTSATFSSLYVQRNELWVHNCVQGTSSLIRFGAIVWLAWQKQLSLFQIGFATFGATAFISLMHLLLWRCRYNSYSISLSIPTIAKAFRSYVAGFHSFLNRNVEALVVNAELFLLNHLNVQVFAVYATFIPVMTAFRLYATFLCSTFEPTWVIWRAENRTRELCHDANLAIVKMVRLVLSPGVATCLYAFELAKFWLGDAGHQIGLLTERYAPFFLAVTCFLPLFFFCYAVGFQRRINIASLLSIIGVAGGSLGLSWGGWLTVESFLSCLLLCYGIRNLIVLPVLIAGEFSDYRLPKDVFVRITLVLLAFYGTLFLRGIVPSWIWEIVRGSLSIAAIVSFVNVILKSR